MVEESTQLRSTVAACGYRSILVTVPHYPYKGSACTHVLPYFMTHRAKREQHILSYPTLIYSNSWLSELLKLITAHAQSRWRPYYSLVCSQLCTVGQRERMLSLSVECKLLFFTMEMHRMPRVLFSIIQTHPLKELYGAVWIAKDAHALYRDVHTLYREAHAHPSASAASFTLPLPAPAPAPAPVSVSVPLSVPVSAATPASVPAGPNMYMYRICTVYDRASISFH